MVSRTFGYMTYAVVTRGRMGPDEQFVHALTIDRYYAELLVEQLGFGEVMQIQDLKVTPTLVVEPDLAEALATPGGPLYREDGTLRDESELTQ